MSIILQEAASFSEKALCRQNYGTAGENSGGYSNKRGRYFSWGLGGDQKPSLNENVY